MRTMTDWQTHAGLVVLNGCRHCIAAVAQRVDLVDYRRETALLFAVDRKFVGGRRCVDLVRMILQSCMRRKNGFGIAIPGGCI